MRLPGVPRFSLPSKDRLVAFFRRGRRRSVSLAGDRRAAMRMMESMEAARVASAADVLVELAPQLRLDLAAAPPEPTVTAPEEAAFESDPAYRKLLNALDFSPISIGDLGTRAELTAAELSSMLLILELEGLVEALPGGRYARLGKRRK